MVAQSDLVSPREHLDRRIAALDAEVERIRAEDGDPAGALGRYLVERFGIEALRATYEEYCRNQYSFMFDDEAEDVEESLDGDGNAGGLAG